MRDTDKSRCFVITVFTNCFIRTPSVFSYFNHCLTAEGNDLSFFTQERSYNYAWEEYYLQKNTFRRYNPWQNIIIWLSADELLSWRELLSRVNVKNLKGCHEFGHFRRHEWVVGENLILPPCCEWDWNTESSSNNALFKWITGVCQEIIRTICWRIYLGLLKKKEKYWNG